MSVEAFKRIKERTIIKEDSGTRYIVGKARAKIIKEEREKLTKQNIYPSWNVKKNRIIQRDEHPSALPQPSKEIQKPEVAIEVKQEALFGVIPYTALSILIMGVLIIVLIFMVFD